LARRKGEKNPLKRKNESGRFTPHVRALPSSGEWDITLGGKEKGGRCELCYNARWCWDDPGKVTNIQEHAVVRGGTHFEGTEAGESRKEDKQAICRAVILSSSLFQEQSLSNRLRAIWVLAAPRGLDESSGIQKKSSLLVSVRLDRMNIRFENLNGKTVSRTKH